MYIPSDKYKEALDNINRNPKSKVIIDGIEYTGMDRIKDHPSIKQEATNFIGEFPTKECKFSLFNRDNNLKIVNKDVQVFRGLVLNDGTIEYIPQGIFHINPEDVITNATAKIIELTVKDKSTVFDSLYGGEDNITYPCTLGTFINEIVVRHGLVLETPKFPMSSFVLERAPNFDKSSTTERYLIASAAVLGGCTVQMSRTGGVKITKPYDIGEDNKIKRKHYQSLASKEEKFGPINSVILGRNNSDNDIVSRDEESIALNGLCEWRIVDNPYVDLVRESVIDTIASQIFGMEIIPFEINNLIDGYLYDINDTIQIEDKQGNMFNTTLMAIESTSRIFTKIKTAIQNVTTTNYKLAGSSKVAMEKVKLDVDHNRKEIEAQAMKTTENSEKIAQLEINVDTIEQQISGEYGMDRETSGTNQIFIEDALKYYPLDFKISGHSNTRNLLYPGTFYPGTSYVPLAYKEPKLSQITICVDSESRDNPTENLKEYPITINEPLRSLGTINDELEISISSDGEITGSITRYLTYTGSQIVKLDKPIVESITAPQIELLEHSNYIYIKEQPDYQIYIRYLLYSQINDFYATKVELATSRKQTEDSITDMVSKTYSTKEELAQEKSERIQTADSINQTVSKKVGKAEVKSSINQSAETVKIQAKNLDLSGLVTVSDLSTAGKTTINGSNITTGTIDASKATIKNINADNITSGTISGDKINGGTITGITIKGNTITGGTLSGTTVDVNSGKIGGWNINSEGLTNGTVFLNNDGSSTIYTVADLIIIRGYIMGTPGFELSSSMIKHYDFNNDGAITTADYVTLQNLIGISMN